MINHETDNKDMKEYHVTTGVEQAETSSAFPPVNVLHYSYRVIWSAEDGEYVGLCAEFPSLSYLDESRIAALNGITDLVKDIVVDMDNNGEKVPIPISEKEYSGKFQVRIPPELHRMLAIEAAEQNISLNRYVAHKLAC